MKRKIICVEGGDYITTEKYTIDQLEYILKRMRHDGVTHFEFQQEWDSISFYAYRLETDEEFKKRIGDLKTKKNKLLKQLKDIEDLEKSLRE